MSIVVTKGVNVVFGQKGAAKLKSSMTELNQGLELAGKLAAGMKKAFDFGKAGAKVADIASAFEKLGGTAKSLGNMRKALGGAVDDNTIRKFSNMANTLQITGRNFEQLLPIARAAAKTLGLDVTSALESVTTGVARQSPKWLDNLGILVDVKGANDKMAESLGITASALTEAQKKTAFFNATLEAGSVIIKNAPIDSMAEQFGQAESMVENFTNALKVFVGMGIAGSLGAVDKEFSELNSTMTSSGGIIAEVVAQYEELQRLKRFNFKRGADAIGPGVADTLANAKAGASAFVAAARKRGEIANRDQKAAFKAFVAAKNKGGGGKADAGPASGVDQGPLLGGGNQAEQIAHFGLITEQFDAMGAAASGPLEAANAQIQAMAANFDTMIESGREAAEVSAGFAHVTGGIMVDGLSQVGHGMARAGVMALFYGESLKKGINQAMNAIFAEAATRALFEGAAGLAALGWGRPDAAALHFASAKGYAAVAVATGIGSALTGGFSAGGGGGGGAGGGSGGFGNPDTLTRDFGGGGSDGNQTTVVNVSLKMDGRKVGQAVATARTGAAPARGND